MKPVRIGIRSLSHQATVGIYCDAESLLVSPMIEENHAEQGMETNRALPDETSEHEGSFYYER